MVWTYNVYLALKNYCILIGVGPLWIDYIGNKNSQDKYRCKICEQVFIRENCDTITEHNLNHYNEIKDLVPFL